MGFLDNSTNNIILDTVLTDYGRQQLAAADSSFKITQYSFADDEVDYRLIKKYGRTVGKEKIEKNTPIFEALTNPSIALKYKLVGRENDGTTVDTVFMPMLILGGNLTSIELTSNTRSKTVQVDHKYQKSSGDGVPVGLIQTSYTLRVPDRFFTIGSGTGASGNVTVSKQNATMDPGDPNRMVSYNLVPTGPAATSITFTITANSIDPTVLSIYGKRNGSGYRTINSFVTIVGDQHGPTLDIPVTYTAASTI